MSATHKENRSEKPTPPLLLPLSRRLASRFPAILGRCLLEDLLYFRDLLCRARLAFFNYAVDMVPSRDPQSRISRFPDPPTLDEFFSLDTAETAETDADICRDITLLSALLKDHRSGKSTVLDAKQAGHSDSELWSHISYVLVPGTSQDLYGNKVRLIAVVGRIEPGFIAATVVAPNSSSSAIKRENPIQVVAMRQFKVVVDMLNNPTTLPDDVPFERWATFNSGDAVKSLNRWQRLKEHHALETVERDLSEDVLRLVT
ncbi:hypothetical protein C8Q74DRAFT_1222571 [Fomes fomentarius]|nr:hypothetical protein C8Q74DRAFT_1222571 [Fomes fomentarius]